MANRETEPDRAGWSWVRRRRSAGATMLAAVAFAAISCSAGSDDTAAICAQRADLEAPGPVLEARERWRRAGEDRDDADPRLIEAIDLMQQAVPDERTMDSNRWNRAHQLLAEVCG